MKAHEKYLKEHGISDEFVELFEITYDKNYLHIPIKDDEGEDLFVKSRYLNHDKNSKEPKYKNSQGSTATLFNLYAVLKSPSVVICEGEIDCIKLMQEGVMAVSSTGGATTFPSHFAEQLKDKKIWIAFDNDEAGQKGTQNLLDMFPHARVIQLPEETKDICDYFVADNTVKKFNKLKSLALTRIEWEASHIPEEFKIMSAKELTSRKYTSMPWLIEGIIYNTGYCFLYGAEGTGKSYVALDMAMAIAKGEDWLDVFKVPNKVPVLYLDKENPHSLMQKRIRGLTNEGKEIPENLYFLKYPEKFQLHDGKGTISDFAIALATLVEEKKIGLIIIDSLIDVMVGSENSSEDTQRFIEAVNYLFPGVAKLPLHHENKPSGGTFRNASQRLRGSSNINAQAFTMFRLEAVAKSKSEITLHQTKARDELKMDKFLVKMEVEHIPEPDGGGTTVSGFTYMGIVTNKDTKKGVEAQELIKEALADSQSGKLMRKELSAIAEMAGVTNRTLDRALVELVKEGVVEKRKIGTEVAVLLKVPIVVESVPEGRLL